MNDISVTIPVGDGPLIINGVKVSREVIAHFFENRTPSGRLFYVKRVGDTLEATVIATAERAAQFFTEGH